MSGTVNVNYVQADLGANLVLNSAISSGAVIAPVPVYTGANAATPLGGATNPVGGGIQSANNYIQSYVYNTANGAFSSADFTAYPNNGTDASGWVDMGITSNNYSQAAYSITGRNEGYVIMSAPSGSGTSGNLVFGTDSTGLYNSFQWYANGFSQAKSNAIMTLDKTGNLTVTGAISGNGSTQAGEIGFFARNTAPTGYIKANGAAISRTTYAALFAAIGTTFGTGDGSTTFNVPDMRGQFPRGWDDSAGVDTGRTFGSSQADDFKSHSHQVGFTTSTAGNSTYVSTAYAGSAFSAYLGATSSTGGTETRPKNIALLACIKY